MAVPASVRRRVDETLGARVKRAVRAYGGYGPSATFVLTLEDASRAFFKGTYPLEQGSAVRWSLDVEERAYRRLGDMLRPWAPAYLGSIRRDGWHVMLLEAVTGEAALPWTPAKAERATRSYAEFHESTAGRPLPAWLPRGSHREFASYWRQITADDERVERLATLAGGDHAAAREWLRDPLPVLARGERALYRAPPPAALLHFDTRSDNIRIDGSLLRIFDWPFACAGPPEIDLAAFAQSIASEGGPPPDAVVGWYSAVRPIRHEVLVASIVGIAGYFADRAPRPDIPGLPRLRWVQRRQLRASLDWAARLLELPRPGWLDALPD